MTEINPYVWYGTRQLAEVPPHFVRASTPATHDSLFWVKAKLVGRYSVYTVPITASNKLDEPGKSFIYFEDSSEAMIYELRWSGSK